MKRQIAGLHAADRCAADQIADGLFLVRVQRVQFRRQVQKPYYTLALAILEPGRFSDHVISSRLYCNPKALWKFNWFLRDFGYDVELLAWIIHEVSSQKRKDALKGMMNTGFRHPAFPFGASIA